MARRTKRWRRSVEDRVAHRKEERDNERVRKRRRITERKRIRKRGRKRKREGGRERKERKREDERKRAERGESVPNWLITTGHCLYYEKRYKERIPDSGTRLIDNRVAARVATHCCFAACETPTIGFHELALAPTHPRAHGQPPPGHRRTSRTTGTSQSCRRPPHPRDLHTTCLPPKVSLLQTARP